ncbi:hypothetical protein GCM10009837_48580 [Streptomyces durmitorensis]|uniref:Uncharacterized protein n=1 Tax=Streptomyces durmitorensis TaxID=319947 RepID=A0ABY4Q2A7_9ACTN|nr:hypothetical protein [Streptomyces durmitorensis]UQT60182.1 hypothetical protein M4V62_36835 [Streptomyces durmitorensis]
MKVHVTISEDAGAAPAAASERQLSVARETAAAGAVDAGPASAAGAEQGPAGSVTDGGESPGWLAELVRLADAGEVARPGEEPQETRGSTARGPSEGPVMEAGSAGPAPG